MGYPFSAFHSFIALSATLRRETDVFSSEEPALAPLEAQGLSSRAEELSAEDLELLAELEHIRWCRYHYLNNWRFGRPENGKAKDPVRRLYAMLIPYDELSEGEKEKDRENIRVLLSIQN